MFEGSSADIAGWVARLADLPADVSDAERIDRLRAMEEVKCALEAAQARDAVQLDTSTRARQQAAGVPARRLGEGVASQLGLARRESPHKGARLLGLARILDREMPHTLALMTDGRLSEWRATILVRETACLTLEHRQEIDRLLCATGDAMTMSDRELENAAKKHAYRLDAEALVARARKAESERRRTIRPAPDCMVLTALLPVGVGVGAFAALSRAADTARSGDDSRSRGQVMADTLVERVTGIAPADGVSTSVQLVMTDRTLLGGDDEPAHIPGYGPIPAGLARDLVFAAASSRHRAVAAWVRRLITTPGAGRLVAMDSRRRKVPAGLRDLVGARDQGTCRTPWCGAPIRHGDHAEEHQSGGPTSEANAQGLCERCNLAKQAKGWTARPRPGPRHAVETVTPTGHRYYSRAPAPPGTDESGSRLEAYLSDLVLIA